MKSLLSKWTYIAKLVQLVVSQLDEEEVRRFLDGVLDLVENAVLNSKTRMDDALVTPAIDLARRVMNIPDYPDEPTS